MSNTIQNFEFNSNHIRVVNNDPTNPLFVAHDVATALGYVRHKQAISQHCKGDVKRVPLSTAGGTQKVRVIAEPDLYRLIFGSKLKTAVQFQDWVTNEVLPSIRKTGKYVNTNPRERFLSEEQYLTNKIKSSSIGSATAKSVVGISTPNHKHLTGAYRSAFFCAYRLMVGVIEVLRNTVTCGGSTNSIAPATIQSLVPFSGSLIITTQGDY